MTYPALNQSSPDWSSSVSSSRPTNAVAVRSIDEGLNRGSIWRAYGKAVGKDYGVVESASTSELGRSVTKRDVVAMVRAERVERGVIIEAGNEGCRWLLHVVGIDVLLL